MAVKLSISSPVLVAMGPSFQEVGWGPYQFPAIHRLADGRIIVKIQVAQDTCEDYGKESLWMESSDTGKTWSQVSDSELPSIKSQFGLDLPSGNCVRNVVYRPYPIDDALHAELTAKAFRMCRSAIPIEDVPDLFPKTWTYAIKRPESDSEEVFDAKLDFPGMVMGLCKGAIVRPFPYGNLRLAPDGSVWQCHYFHGRNPENMGSTGPYYACYFLQSTDECRTFRLRSWIQYDPDTNEFPEAFTVEGYCEPDLCFLPDGSMIVLLRTDGGTPSYISRSTDGGSTWSKPVKFDRCGVLPQLLALKCGVTLASYGRPGVFVRATDDPHGMAWDEPAVIKPYCPEKICHDSCSYTQMIPLDDHTAMLAYSDFEYIDEQGRDHKSIMVRTITVEK